MNNLKIKVMKQFKLTYKNLTIDPIENGRLSVIEINENEYAVVDAYLNNKYSEQEFINDLNDVIATSHDAFHEAADEMNIDVKDIRVYDAQMKLTDRSIADYIETQINNVEYIDYNDYK